MSDIASWVGVAIGIAALTVAYFTYRSQRRETRLEYVIVSNARVVPKSILNKLQVYFADSQVYDASVSIIRLANTGNRAILEKDFSSSLTIRVAEVNEIVSALSTKTRPAGLRPQFAIDSSKGTSVAMAPLMLNPGDLIEVQFLTSGLAENIEVESRIANVPRVVRRKSLPYNPGTGTEGELQSFDKFMWFVFPVPLILVTVLLAAFADGMTKPVKVVTVLAILVVGFVIYPMRIKHLVERRALWRI